MPLFLSARLDSSRPVRASQYSDAIAKSTYLVLFIYEQSAKSKVLTVSAERQANACECGGLMIMITRHN
jgi:hypothetical protein